MKKCAKCGKENIDKAIYCANCGAKLDVSSNVSTSSSGGLNSGSASKSSSNQSNASQKSGKDSFNFKTCCCYVPAVLLIIFLIVGMIMNVYPESFPTTYEEDFGYLDINGDGRLSFDEARQYDPYMEDKEMKPYFLEADKNSNGYLIGYEFDSFRSDVRYSDSSIYSTSSSSSSSDDDKYKYSSSSSSSSSSNKHKHSSSSSGTNKYVNELNDMEFDNNPEGYVLTCPYCGSEAIYETGGYYKCAECGSSIYDPDDLELAYTDGYMDLLAPISLTTN